jgi:glycosyltransferase involved in cell wall biosynthesis
VLASPEAVASSRSPTVSVILATNRICTFLETALDSVARQTWKDWELVVVDDGSPDPSSLRALLDARPEAVVVRQPNRGLAQARNAGCAAARGTYITFLDDDDFWPDDRLERQLRVLGDTGEDVVGCFGLFKYVDEAGDVFGDGPLPDTAAAALSAGFHIGTLMVKADAINRAGLFNAFLSTHEDIDFSLRLGYVGALVYVPETLLFYRRHAANMTNNLLIANAYARAVFEYHYRLAKLTGDIATNRAIGTRLASGERYVAISAGRSAKALLAQRDLRGFAAHTRAALSSAYVAGIYIARQAVTKHRQ